MILVIQLHYFDIFCSVHESGEPEMEIEQPVAP